MVSGDQVQEYSVGILKVYPKASTTGRNLLLRVNDPTTGYGIFIENMLDAAA